MGLLVNSRWDPLVSSFFLPLTAIHHGISLEQGPRVAAEGGEADASAGEADTGAGEQAEPRGGASNRGRQRRPERGQGHARGDRSRAGGSAQSRSLRRHSEREGGGRRTEQEAGGGCAGMVVRQRHRRSQAGEFGGAAGVTYPWSGFSVVYSNSAVFLELKL
jgi:hypothetical protein